MDLLALARFEGIQRPASPRWNRDWILSLLNAIVHIQTVNALEHHAGVLELPESILCAHFE